MMNIHSLNVSFTYKRFGQALRIIGWSGASILFVAFYAQPILMGGVGKISVCGWGVLAGVAIGMCFGYLIGAGKAIVINFEDNDLVVGDDLRSKTD